MKTSDIIRLVCGIIFLILAFVWIIKLISQNKWLLIFLVVGMTFIIISELILKSNIKR